MGEVVGISAVWVVCRPVHRANHTMRACECMRSYACGGMRYVCGARGAPVQTA